MIKKHPTSEVSPSSKIGDGTEIWNHVQIRENAEIGENCSFGKNVYIDFGVKIGNNVKVQNNCSIYHGVTLEGGVFVGPHVCFTNDKFPRAINLDGSPKSEEDWEVSKTLVKDGASIGANSTILSGLTIGRFSTIGAGSVVTKDVPDFGLVVGIPARLIGFVCACGRRLGDGKEENNKILFGCDYCGEKTRIGMEEYKKLR